ncbi:tRNA-splicing endonuclease subunit sen34 [Pseudovirgaria hyperparasitica]|uniref:tRNA-splicing endonuclease subunit Sen34 n=1 Tax=Pseudovirgaria hyperparasitica TaxID=470096 RepID=A0A6A6VSA5_9PEZI|nr:tRNA-splicing endonuclease subunit sen34 [Pseudovirgaria hyperparasitica]KAF2753035.1 tRNA-splicing endonuclease subunit sen34 [Pseudovirgaria hyperparasitica]
MADVTTPIPISVVQGRYLLFDTPTIAYLRREHNVCGVLIGTIPHVSQQNVFLGVPLELMPEEARVLVEKGVAYLVDDALAHREGIWGMSAEEQRVFKSILATQGRELSLAGKRQADKKREEHFKREREKKGKAKDKPASGDLLHLGVDEEPSSIASATESSQGAPTETDDDVSLFSGAPSTPVNAKPELDLLKKVDQWHITPMTSHPPLPMHAESSLPLPAVGSSYPLFSHLYKKGYFMTPGLRFGCKYCVYPGDPLRYHSHFLAVGKDWDEEFNLLDLVGGGRLGTAVKKGYLVGGREPQSETSTQPDDAVDVRTFCIEWAGM